MMDEGLREQGIQREITFACDAIMYEQYVILYCIVGTHLSGTQRLCTRPLEV